MEEVRPVWTTKARKGVKETIEILSVSTFLFTYSRCSIWPPLTSIHFVYRLISLNHVELLERFLAYHGWLQVLLVFVPTRSCCGSTGVSYTKVFMFPRNLNLMLSCQVSERARLLSLYVQSIRFLRCHTTGDPGRSCGTNKNHRVIRDMPGIFQRVWHDLISRYTKHIEVGGGHIEHIL